MKPLGTVEGSMMRRLAGGALAWAALSVAGISTGCFFPPAPSAPAPEDSAVARRELNDAFGSYWRAVIPSQPRLASALGRPVDAIPPPVVRPGSGDQSQLRARRFGRDLDAIEAAALAPADYAALQTLRWELEMEAEGATYRDIDFSFLSPSASSLGDALELLQDHVFAANQDLDRYLLLLDGLTFWMSEARGVLSERARTRMVASRDVVQSFSAFLRRLGEIARSGALEVPAARIAALDTSLTTQFRDEERAGVQERLIPAIDSLVGFLEAYESTAMERPGLWQYQGGKEYYRHLLRRRLGLEVEPEEVQQAAVSQLRRVDSLLGAVARRLGRTAPLRLDSLRQLPAFGPIPVEAVVAQMQSHFVMMRDTLRSQVTALPDTAPLVRAARPLEALLHPEGRVRPPEDVQERTELLVTPWWGTTTTRLEGPARAFQWGWPGRALSATVSYSTSTMNAVVLLHPTIATTAGWEEYSASMGGELGYYADPLAAWGRLMQEGLNAAWLVVDTGIHYYGWSRAQALATLRPYSLATNEELDSLFVARVVQAPGAAGAAAIGGREVAAMRTWMQRLLGPAFVAADWHRELLTLGPVPLPVLAAHLEWWGWDTRRRAEVQRRSRP